MTFKNVESLKQKTGSSHRAEEKQGETVQRASLVLLRGVVFRRRGHCGTTCHWGSDGDLHPRTADALPVFSPQERRLDVLSLHRAPRVTQGESAKGGREAVVVHPAKRQSVLQAHTP